ncbi:MAG: ABC transporter permease [Gammaproteobacteria bacterium]|nr:ABC transporter permease [Gammaproteobacteria bacterium]
MNSLFSWQRLLAIISKEFTQMKRDRLTFAMIIGIPFIQLVLFGYAINSDPKNLPTAVVAADDSSFTRTLINDFQNSAYFKILPGNMSNKKANWLLETGQAQFIICIPPDFSQKLVRAEKPELLVEADATDPAATSNAISAIQMIIDSFGQHFSGSLSYLKSEPPPVNLIIQPKYNPGRITQFNIVPGLLGVVLTMTMVVITSLAITRERERGTMESLLAMPVRPLEVMLGKLIPYIFVGYIQVVLILLAAYYLFDVPFNGSVLLLFVSCLPFIAANLAVGLTFSTLAKNQLQAMQLSFFFFLPSILLSGFMFPFHGMPDWAQTLGNTLPLTHFLLIVRGIMLKGNGVLAISHSVGAILLFFIFVLVLGIKRYRQTLD